MGDSLKNKKITADLRIIKKKYGEEMMHLCRKLFSTLLDEPGLLPKQMLKLFEPTRFLYEDIEKVKNILTENNIEYKGIYKIARLENGTKEVENIG